jgi:hypothetical protein
MWLRQGKNLVYLAATANLEQPQEEKIHWTTSNPSAESHSAEENPKRWRGWRWCLSYSNMAISELPARREQSPRKTMKNKGQKDKEKTKPTNRKAT